MAVVLLVTLGRISASMQELCIAEKAITIGVFYRLPNQAKFMDLMVGRFSN